MPKVYDFTQEQYEEVKKAEDNTKNAGLAKKLQAVRLRMEGYTRKEVAQITQYSESRVSALVSIYASKGLSYFLQENRKGGNHCNMSKDEEAELLQSFEEAAQAGQIVSTQDIESAYREKVGHTIGSGQIYRVLARHKWRKVKPRSRHPQKATREVIEASKKLTIGFTN
jgi:transposase